MPSPPHSLPPCGACADCWGLHDHLHGPREYRVRGARDPKRYGFLDGHDRVDIRFLPVGLRFLSNYWGMAGRSHRRSARAGTWCCVVVGFHFADCIRLECDFDGSVPVSVRDGGGGSISHCHQVPFALDAADGTRLRPGYYPRGITFGSSFDPSSGRHDDGPFWMAYTIFRIRSDRIGLVGDLVLVLPRHAGGTLPYQRRGTSAH